MLVEIKTNNIEEIRQMLEQDGIEDYGEEGFGTEVVEALRKLGVQQGDQIEIFRYWDDELGAGTINGRTFYEDIRNAQLRFTWRGNMV